MAEKPKKVLGYYYKIGSSDYPFNLDINEPFGWDLESSSTTPVFKYSINDVEKAFIEAREFHQAANYTATSTQFLGDSVGATNCILVECGKTDEYDYTAFANEDPTSDFWKNVFRCAEFIGGNQASISQASLLSGFINFGDYSLASVQTPDGSVNPYYVSNYVKGSLTYSARASSSRLQWCQFVINDQYEGNITIQIYYDADAWCERTSTVAYKVYRYDDLDGDATISNQEMDSQVVGKIFDILKDGKYKSYSSIIIDKRISDTTTTTEQFFVFSSLKENLTSTKMKEKVKEYLREVYSEDETYLRYTYPTLFDENEIRIIPIWDNQISQATGEAKDVHPLSIAKLSSVLSTFGYSSSQSSPDYRPTEVFYLGPGSGWNTSISLGFILPLIAIEQDTTSGVNYPISSRFPDYKPIYGQNEPGAASEFHFILLQIVNYLNATDTALNKDFIEAYSVSKSTSGSRKVVTFTYSNDIWSVYGPVGSASIDK